MEQSLIAGESIYPPTCDFTQARVTVSSARPGRPTGAKRSTMHHYGLALLGGAYAGKAGWLLEVEVITVA